MSINGEAPTVGAMEIVRKRAIAYISCVKNPSRIEGIILDAATSLLEGNPFYGKDDEEAKFPAEHQMFMELASCLSAKKSIFFDNDFLTGRKKAISVL